MAFQRPSLPELVDRIQEDLASRLDQPGGVLRRSVVHVLARVIAGAAHMLHGHVVYLTRQIFPDQSDADFLLRQAELFGIRRNAATFAEAEVIATGTDSTPIPEGSVLIRSDGAEYVTQAAATITDGSALLVVIAREAGADGTLEVGAELVFESPIAGVSSTATVSLISNRGEDEESIDSLRERLIARLQSPPHGGTTADYLAWAREVPGVTRAWVYPLEQGAGSVVVRFVRDDDPDIIPDAPAIAAVQAHIDEVRPVTAAVSVLAPVPEPLDLELQITPDTEATRAAVTAELVDLLRQIATPGGTIPLSRIRTAVETADGVTSGAVLSPIADITHAPGHLATLGEITWS